MKLIAPEGYDRFRCIAGACSHTCCRGWEIDIDEDTLEWYETVPDPLGGRLREQIEDGHFRLGEDERCPFLNAQGLCDLITELGEDALCQVCADHPRYRAFLTDRTEIGLGLCCEEAARQQLLREAPFRLILLEDDGEEECLPPEEEELLNVRDRMLAIAADRLLPLDERLRRIAAEAGIACNQLSPVALAERYLPLERLEPEWSGLLENLRDTAPRTLPEWTLPMEQLLCCLIYRHILPAVEDDRPAERTAFVLESLHLIRSLFALSSEQTTERLTEIVRLWSSEIEYSDENIETLLTSAEAAEVHTKSRTQS